MKNETNRQSLYIREKPVFICGHPKSGTSLLRSLLDNHPQLIVFPEETYFFRKFLPRSEGLSLKAQLELAEELLIHIFKWNVSDPPAHQAGYPDRDYQNSISFDQVRKNMEIIANEKLNHSGDILRAAILAYGSAINNSTSIKKWWVEKSTYNELFFSQIIRWWPDAHFIHVVRDPRDNFASYRRKHPEWSASFFSRNWLRSTNSGLINQGIVGPKQYWLLRYEELTNQPDESINKLCDFLSIEDSSTLRIPTRNGEVWKGNSMFADRFDQISSSPVGRWEEDLNPQDAYIIQWSCKTIMQMFNYEIKNTYTQRITIRSWIEVVLVRIRTFLSKQKIS
jgi:hypothetical protein